jgi:hypothetical protein
MPHAVTGARGRRYRPHLPRCRRVATPIAIVWLMAARLSAQPRATTTSPSARQPTRYPSGGIVIGPNARRAVPPVSCHDAGIPSE